MAKKTAKNVAPVQMSEADAAKLREAAARFDLNVHIINFLSSNAFYAEISRRVHKISTKDIPTAAVAWNQKLDNIVLYYNPEFMCQHTPKQVIGILKHEFSHLFYGHLNARRKTPHRMWNIATDLAINSLIVSSEQNSASYSNINNPQAVLPECALIPGHPVFFADLKRPLTADEKAAQPIAALIEKMKPLLASEDYFQQLMKVAKEQQNTCPMCGGSGKIKVKSDAGGDENSSDGRDGVEKEGQDKGENDKGNGSSRGDDSHDEGCEGDGNCSCGHGDNEPGGCSGPDGEYDCPCCKGDGELGDGIGSMDDHGFWDDIPEDMREYVENRVRNVIERAVESADQSSNGWGYMPASIREEIRRFVSKKVPWRSVLRQFIGVLLPGDRSTSIKRINRRYPYIHPGVKRGRKAKLLVAIDMSGSVGEELLATFFAELTNLAKNCEIDVVPFDCSAEPEHIVKWRRGGPPPMGRVKAGGTSFDAPTDLANDPKNRGRWDGLLIVTDGICNAPKESRVRRGWVLGPGCKLQFDSNELQVFVDNERPMVGAWR
jgi:predicted metal-dependent peptidase